MTLPDVVPALNETLNFWEPAGGYIIAQHHSDLESNLEFLGCVCVCVWGGLHHTSSNTNVAPTLNPTFNLRGVGGGVHSPSELEGR